MVFRPGFIIIDDVVAPVLHLYDTPPVAVNVEDFPLQNELFPETTTTGTGCTITFFEVVELQPCSSVTVTI